MHFYFFHLQNLKRLALLCLCGLVFALVQTQAEDLKEEESEADKAHRTYLELLREENKYPSAVSCSQCHPDHFEEWSVSPHSYAMLSPVFQSMHTFITQRTGGTNGDFCIRCHTPVGMEREEDMFTSTLLRSPSASEGVTCIACHRISDDFGTTSGRISLNSGPLTDPIYGPGGNEDLKAAINSDDYGLITDPEERGKLVHREARKSPVISRSAQCSMCHDVNSPIGLRLESASTEFKHSPAAKDGTSCQDCHMNLTPGVVPPKNHRYAEDGRDLNYAFEPAARVRNSPHDPGEGKATPPGKRSNHMFIGPDYSIVHPGLFPHSLETVNFTYSSRFRDVLSDEAKELVKYLKTLPPGTDTAAKQKEAEKNHLHLAEASARKHAKADWLDFQWWKGWGTEAFEDKLSAKEKENRLKGVNFPWADTDDPDAATARRKTARLILSKQFNLLNRAHIERTRLLRRGLQLGDFEISKDDQRGIDFAIDVRNPMTGHAVPTGFDAERIMYLEVSVTDVQGRTLFQSGDRDPNGDLRDLHSAYVHESASKTGEWLAVSDWKEPLGLKRSKEDLYWRPDPYLFSLQSKFIARNLGGGEREQVLALNTSIDPIPFVRPPSRANVHTGRGGNVRKFFRTIPPLGKKTAKYRIDSNQLSGERPYRLEIKLIAQMVPVNLVKEISPVGFDMNLSAREVGKRVAFGHEVDASGNRRGGAVTIWNKSLILEQPSKGLHLNFSPEEPEILDVPVVAFPFPHTSAEELAAREAALRGSLDVEEFMIQTLGPLKPELWPGGIPEGLPLLPENSIDMTKVKAEKKPQAEARKTSSNS